MYVTVGRLIATAHSETTFSQVGNPFRPIRKRLSKQIKIFKRGSVVIGYLSFRTRFSTDHSLSVMCEIKTNYHPGKCFVRFLFTRWGLSENSRVSVANEWLFLYSSTRELNSYARVFHGVISISLCFSSQLTRASEHTHAWLLRGSRALALPYSREPRTANTLQIRKCQLI